MGGWKNASPPPTPGLDETILKDGFCNVLLEYAKSFGLAPLGAELARFRGIALSRGAWFQAPILSDLAKIFPTNCARFVLNCAANYTFCAPSGLEISPCQLWGA